ncbi:13453_t:CDS:1, partial [Dentiscutata heterogama]
MLNQRKKKKDLCDTPLSTFTSARTYTPDNISEKSTPRSEIAQKLNFYRKKL